MVAITLNETFLEESLVDTMRELEVGNSDDSNNSDGNFIEREDSNMGDYNAVHTYSLWVLKEIII